MNMIIDELKRLSKLHKDGSLNDEEFAQAKRKLLSHMFAKVPIAGLDGVFVTVFRPKENLPRVRSPGKRFARCFSKTWKRLPLAARHTLLKYWGRQPGRLQIELSTFRLDGFGATCSDGGFTLRFQPWFEVFQSSQVEQFIAHELAHAFRYASGTIKLFDVETEEIETRKVVTDWGFRDEPYNPSDYREELEFQKRVEALRRPPPRCR